MNPQMVLIGLTLGVVITAGLFWWLRRLKRQLRRDELELPWSEHLDGTLARRLVKQVTATIGLHWPLVLNWTLQHKWEKQAAAIVLEPSIHLTLFVGNEEWVSHEDHTAIQVPEGKWSLNLLIGTGKDRQAVFMTDTFYIVDAKPPDFIDASAKSDDLDWLADRIMSSHPHPRQLLAVLDNDVIERRLLRALGHPEAISRQTITSANSIERGLSMVEGETVLGEVMRMRDSDSLPPEQLSDTV